MNVASLLTDVIHQEVLPERVGSSEVGLAAAKFSNLLDEMDQAVVARKHESIDQDARALALRNFFHRLRDDQRVQSESVFVNASIFERQSRRFAVSDHYNLAHVLFLPRENPLR